MTTEASRIVIDLDGTLTVHDPATSYAEQRPRHSVVESLRRYKEAGYIIVIHTARNMRTFAGNLGQINVHTLPSIIEWLREHEVPFDEIVIGKPWCGHEGFYVDDRAVRPAEFIGMLPGDPLPEP